MYFVNISKCWFWWLLRTPKMLGQRHVNHCQINFFITHLKHLGIKNAIFLLKFCQQCFCTVLLDSRLQLLSSSHSHCCLIILFMTGHIFSIGDRSAGQHCCGTCRMRPGIVLIKQLWTSREKQSWWQYTNPIYASMSMVPSHMCKSTMPFALMHPYTMTNVCFCFCNWFKSGWSLSSLRLTI